MNLLSIGSDAKTVKGQKYGYYTGIQYLAPSDASDVINTCPNASKGCREACLFTAGRAGVWKSINEARINRTKLFANNKDAYFKQLTKEIKSLIVKAQKDNYTACVRLNGTSDIDWENIKNTDGKTIMELFGDIQFYDYTKSFKRMVKFLNGDFPKNYHLTFSQSENNQKQAKEVVKMGGNISVVFAKLPQTYLNKNVIDGDVSDLRFNDDKNVIVGLKAKGKARKDKTGFVVV